MVVLYYVYTSLQYQYIAMLHNSIGIGIGIAKGQYYWILCAMFGIVLTLNYNIYNYYLLECQSLEN